MRGVRILTAPNPGPFTLDGTRTYVVGHRAVAIIDPGPDDPGHLDAVAELVSDAASVRILLTHDHADHTAGAAALGAAVGAAIHGPGGEQSVADGQAFATDAGTLVALSTPGHTRAHVTYHLADEAAAFVGDLILGEGDTTWIGEYVEGIADYFRSLDRIGALAASVLYPGHGPPLTDPPDAIRRFRRHRAARIDQVKEALATNPDLDAAGVVEVVYGPLPDRLRAAAVASVEAVMDHLAAGS